MQLISNARKDNKDPEWNSAAAPQNIKLELGSRFMSLDSVAFCFLFGFYRRALRERRKNERSRDRNKN